MDMGLNLALDRWIPVLRKGGEHERIAPWQIWERENPALRVDGSRPAENGALTEFLIALHTTVFLPGDAGEWRRRWGDPPEPGWVRKELSKVAPLFGLSGSRPFMQDPTLLLAPPKKPGEEHPYRKPVQKLLVDGVSDNQEKFGADLFVKSGAISSLCLPCAAAALFDLQVHAPQGSAGYYTSLRGGGPISTLVRCPELLRKTVWANVVEQSFFGMKGRPDPETFLPWVSKIPKDAQNYLKPDRVAPLHVLWSMPRRILLEPGQGGTCDTCGEEAPEAVHSYLAYRGGIKYSELDWTHPYSPYVRRKEGEGSVVRPTASDLEGYRHWMGLLVDTPDGDGRAAFVVRRWLERDLPGESKFDIWGYGWQADQASVGRWCEGLMPCLSLGNGHRPLVEAFLRTLVALSQRAAERLAEALKGAWKSSENFTPLDTYKAQNEFWARTEWRFLEELRRATENPWNVSLTESADLWMRTVQTEALRVYETYISETRTRPEWQARYAHKLRRLLSNRNPSNMKTRLYGDWRITDV